MAWTTPTTVNPGDAILASLWNSQVKGNMDELAPFSAAWTSYTPTVAQGTATNIAKTVTYAKYLQVGRMVMVQANLSLTGTGQATNSITVTLPVARSRGGFDPIGTADYFSGAGVKYKLMMGMSNSTTVCRFQYMAANTDDVLGASGAMTAAVANGHILSFSAFYEAA